MLLKIFKTILFFLVCFYAFVYFSSPTFFINADLGRHLTNGKLFFQGIDIFHTNLYSYTETNFPFANHHWGAGILFYLLQHWFGMDALSLIYSSLLALTFAIFLFIARRLSTTGVALMLGVYLLPLMATRIEIRPEGMTTLCLAIYLSFLFLHREGKISSKWLLLLLPLQFLWVNIHSFFLFGIYLIGVFWIDAILHNCKEQIRPLLILLGLTVVVSCINPAGPSKLLIPLTIFKAYGYRLAENMNVFFMIKRFEHKTPYWHCLATVCLAFCLVGYAVFKQGWRKYFIVLALLIPFGIMALAINRMMASFAFIALPLLSWLVYGLFSTHAKRLAIAAYIVIAGFILMPWIKSNSYFAPTGYLSHVHGLKKISITELIKKFKTFHGMWPHIQHSAEFFKSVGLRGPIFNNYDIGGYLIYHLYPQEKVFVDNRPEAYPVSFFKDIYEPMQKNDMIWHKIANEYKFNVIYFYRLDMTQWAQPFLIRRLNDPQWVPVFADPYTIILAKRNFQNQAIINRFELPKSMFSAITE